MDLLDAAKRARANAYAPYSGYAVGAAVRDEQGRVHSGCNVENVSYGLTLCAERAAIARMVAESGKKVAEIVIVTQDGGAPCGMCLQALLEFARSPDSLRVQTVDEQGNGQTFSLADLLPQGFCSNKVDRA